MKLVVGASQRRTLWLVVGLALLLRLAVGLASGLSAPPEPGSDEKEYDTYAWNLAQGRGYRGLSPDVADQDHLTAYRAPGTSVVWAGLYVLFGHRYDVVRVFHSVVGAAGVLLVFGIGRRCFGAPTGLIAAAIWAVMPTALLSSASLLSEPLGTAWLLAHVWAVLSLAERPSWGGAGISGALLGAAILTRPNFVVLVPLEAVWALWQFRGHWHASLRALAVPLVGLLALAPWTARNYVRFGHFIPLTTGGGSALLQGNNRLVATEPRFYGYSVWDTTIPEYRDALRTTGDEYQRDRRAREFALTWLEENRDKWLFLAQAKLRRAFTPLLQPTSPKGFRLGMLLAWGPVLVLFLAALPPTLVAFLRSGHPGWIVHIVILHHALLTVVFFGNARYRQPIEPFCVILAARALLASLEWARGAWSAWTSQGVAAIPSLAGAMREKRAQSPRPGGDGHGRA